MSNIRSIFDLDEFRPHLAEWQRRQARFAMYWAYFKAEPTGNTMWRTDFGRMIGGTINSAIKPIFTPLGRAVELDVALIPGGWAIATKLDEERVAVERLFLDSRWAVEGDIYVRYVTALGEAGVRVNVNPEGRVWIQPVRPDGYLLVPNSVWDGSPRWLITVRRENENEYAEVIGTEIIRTFQNGILSGVNGNPAEYPNPYGLIPFVNCVMDNGDGVGEPTFDNTLVALEQLNRQATYMATIISRHAEPQWAVFGAEAGELEKSGEAVWFFPAGSEVKAVLAAVDFPGLLTFIQEIKKEMKESLPELALSQLVGVERVAAATIELQMAETVFKIRRLRKPIDQALAEAVQMAGKIARRLEIGGFEQVGNVMFDADRPVIAADNLTRLQVETARNNYELTRLAFQREVALGMGA